MMNKFRVRFLLCLALTILFAAVAVVQAAEHTYKMKVDACWT